MKDYKHSELYFADYTDKQILIDVVDTGITIDNSMIEQGSFSLTETLCSQQMLTFGSCESNTFSVTVRGMPCSIKGKTVVVRECLNGNTDDLFTYGTYVVDSDVPTADRTKRVITAHDAMYDIVNADAKSWYTGLTFPMTLRQFRDSFFSYLGIVQKEVTLVNDGMAVNKTLVASQTDPDSVITAESAISGKAVVTAICEINGVFGNINRDGQFEYVELTEIVSPLYPANDLYPSDDLFPRDPNTISMTGHYITFDYEDFQTKNTTQLEIRPSDNSTGAVVGTSGNNYVISGNFLVSDKTGTELETIAANTLSIIRKASYTPLKSSEIVGNPCIELGDPIRFNTTREIVESYVLQRTLTGIQNKRDRIVSPGVETYDQNPNSIRDQISNVQRRTNKLERTADHTLSELADLDANTSSRFEQTAEQIQSEVTRATGAEDVLSSGITQNAESISTEVSNRQNADNEMSSKISQNAQEIASEVTARQTADNEMTTKISQTAHSIALIATGGENSVGITIQLYDENGNLIDTDNGNANITIVGVVKFEDLQNAGKTIINGANILTGTISADKLIAGALTAGSVRTSDGKTVIDLGQFIVTDGVIQVQNSSGNSTISPERVYSKELYASNDVYSAGTIYSDGNINCGGSFVGNLSGNASSASTASSASSASTATYATYLSNGVYVYITGQGNFVPSSSAVACGTNTNPFNVGRAVNGWTTTSDERAKKDFEALDVDDRYERMFYLLEPIKYRFKSDENGKLHVGFVAQKVKKAMDTTGISENEFYGYIHEYADRNSFDSDEAYQDFLNRNNGNQDTYSLSYQEFIPINTYMIQKQHAEIEALKQEKLALQNRLSILEQRMEVLENVINNQNN